MTTEPRIYCLYCGRKLSRDHVGKYRKTHGCQWQFSVSDAEQAIDDLHRRKKRTTPKEKL